MNIILGMPLDKEGKPLIETAPLSPETPVGAAIGTSVSTGIYLLGAIATIKLAIDQLRGLKGLDDEQELEKQRVSASVNLQRGFYQLMSTATSTVKDGFSISKQLGTLGGDLIKNFDKIVNSLGVATAAFGIAVNGLNLIVSSYRAHKAGKRQRALEKLTVGEELKTEHAYALKRGKNKERRKGVEAGAAGLGLIAGGAAVAALLGVAMATPVGWGLAAGAGLVGMGMLGYKAGRKAYKYQHRKNKAKALVEGLLAGDETDRKTITELGLSPDALQQQIAKGGANGLEAARTAVYLKLKEKRTRYARTIFELLKQGSQDAKELVKALGFEDEAYLLKKDEDAAVKLIADKLTSW